MISSLQKLLSTYPTPLTNDLVDELYSLVNDILPNDPSAIHLRATRNLKSIEQEDFVDRLKETQDLFASAVKLPEMDKELISKIYAQWVEEWVEKIDEENLVCQLLTEIISILTSWSNSGCILSTHSIMWFLDFHLPSYQPLSRRWISTS